MKHSSEAFLFALVPIAVLAAFAAPVSAQVPTNNTRQIRPPVLGLPYTQTGIGDFDGDANLDVAYLCGGNLGVMVAPAIFEVSMNNITPANDFAVVSTHTTARILTASNSVGLREWRMERAPLTTEPDPDPNANPPTWMWNSVSVVSTDLSGALFLKTWSIDPGTTYVVALNAGGTGLTAMKRTETGGPLNWTVTWTVESTLTFNPPVSALDLVPFNFDGVGAPEVALVRPTALDIYRMWDSGSPALVTTVPALSGYSATAVDVVHHAGQGHEWLAFVITQNLDGVTQKFMTYGYDGWRNILLIGGALHVYTLRACRLDADGSDDLLIGMHSDSGVAKVFNTGNFGVAPKFSLSDYLPVTPGDPGIASISNVARPFAGDFDGDGDCDFGFPIRNEDEMWLGWGLSSLSVMSQPSLVSRIEGSSTEVAVDLTDANQNGIHFQVFTPVFPSNAPAGPKYLEVKLYSMRYDSSSLLNYVEPIAFSTERVLLTASLPAQFDFDRNVPGDQGQFGPGFNRIAYITAQCLVAADATSNPTWAGPCMMAIVQGQDEFALYSDGHPTVHDNRSYVNDHADANLGELFEIGDHSFVGWQSSGGSVGNGGYVPCIPVRPERPPR